ncbi:MAG TPA: hypothetical protein VMV69_03685 [Pirellulales bacterium]|nr:hypothetical protein [Pirellulales bacterium]
MPTATPVILASPLDYPAFEVAAANLARLHDELDTVEVEVAEFLGSRKTQADDFDSRVARAVAGDTAPVLTTAVTSDEHRYAHLCDRRRVLTAAVEIAERHLGTVRTQVSRQHAEAIRAEYTEVIRDMAGVMEQLVELARREHDLRTDTIEAGFSCFGSGALVAMPGLPLGAGRDFDEGNFFTRFIDDARTHYGFSE